MANTKLQKRRQLWERQGGRCHWCGQLTNRERLNGPSPGHPSRPDDPTLDHVVPRSKGGGGGIGNLVMACQRCNSSRNSSMDWKPTAPVPMPVAEEDPALERLRQVQEHWLPMIKRLRCVFGKGIDAIRAVEDVDFLLTLIDRLRATPPARTTDGTADGRIDLPWSEPIRLALPAPSPPITAAPGSSDP